MVELSFSIIIIGIISEWILYNDLRIVSCFVSWFKKIGWTLVGAVSV